MQAIPAEFQRLQEYKNLLLENAEKILLSVHPVLQNEAPFYAQYFRHPSCMCSVCSCGAALKFINRPMNQLFIHLSPIAICCLIMIYFNTATIPRVFSHFSRKLNLPIPAHALGLTSSAAMTGRHRRTSRVKGTHRIRSSQALKIGMRWALSLLFNYNHDG